MSDKSRETQPHNGTSKRKNITLDLSTARQMLPLVRSIVTEIVDTNRQLKEMNPVREVLDENRRVLDWANRRKRYTLSEELERAEKNLSAAVVELDTLGVALVDANAGQVEFPTKINGRQAAFTWKLGEEGVGFWRYSGEAQTRPIPTDWQSGAPIRNRSRV